MSLDRMLMRPGRDCPLDYRLPHKAFDGPAQFGCKTLYVVGGLYGNTYALDALEMLLADEPEARVVFNGDLHWFDRDPEIFRGLEDRVAPHVLLRGNVETELVRVEDSGTGCGCAYPEEVTELTVAWSNSIHERLCETFATLPLLRASVALRPAHALVEIAGRTVAISHGDERSLAGWQCSREALRSVDRQKELADWMAKRKIDVFATSHTCSPAALSWGSGAVINNGAAGIPNFSAERKGLVTRIASSPHPQALYRAQILGLYVEAISLDYEHVAFLQDFDRQWPSQSPAALSYRDRLLNGTDDLPSSALLGGFQECSVSTQKDPLS